MDCFNKSSKTFEESPRACILFFFINLSMWYYLLLMISCELINIFSSYFSGILNFFLKLSSSVKRIAVMIYLETYSVFIIISKKALIAIKLSISFCPTIKCKLIDYFNWKNHVMAIFIAEMLMTMPISLSILQYTVF